MLNSFYPFGKDPILNGMSSHQSKKMQRKMEWLRAEAVVLAWRCVAEGPVPCPGGTGGIMQFCQGLGVWHV